MTEPATIYIGPRRYWHEYAEQVSLPHHDIANLVRGFTLCRRHGRNSALLLGGLGIRLLDTGTAKAPGTTLRLAGGKCRLKVMTQTARREARR